MITSLRVQNLRCYKDESFEFDGSVNIIVGPNASGKTTILEALITNLSGKSFKGRDTELIKEKASWARIDVGSEKSTRVCKIQKEEIKANKIFDIDGKEYKRLSLQNTMPVVLFEPNNLMLLHGSPENRRSFLDELISQVQPGYGSVLRNYRRVLAQRNALLKQTKALPDQLFVWNLRLSELGGKIASERTLVSEKFNKSASQIYSEISGAKTKVILTYDNKLPISNYESHMLKKLEQSLERDKLAGFTTTGPHREDMSVILNNKNAEETASRGEIRSLVLVLKMIEAEIIEKARSNKPYLMLDDVFSELDGKRRQALVSFLKPYQSFITTTDADVVIEHFTNKTHITPTG